MNKTEVLRLRISESEKEAIKEIASSKQMSMSEYILYLIRRNIEEEEKKNK